MYEPIKTQPSCARAWVAAATAITKVGEGYNVIVDVEDPVACDAHDAKVIGEVDAFLRNRDLNPVSTVANTIFPQSLCARFGRPAFYAEYLKVFDGLTSSKKWGRYFERMIRHRTLEGVVYNPLDELVEKLREQVASNQRFKATHELAIYDPLFDRRYRRGGQCLSFVSMKLHPDRGLTLTALYRNHHYITRCLGNLIGLGRLQAFVARESGVKVGPLTCVSTHAELDVGKGWTLSDARQLVSEAAAVFSGPSMELGAVPSGAL